MKQIQIYRIQDAIYILKVLIQFQIKSEKKLRKQGLGWTKRMLSKHTGMHVDRCGDALKWLLNKGLAWYDQGEYRVSVDGIDYHEACRVHPLMSQAKEAEWKREALSGMRLDGSETEIINAVVPK